MQLKKLLLLCALWPVLASASHIVGGVFYYDYLGNDQYAISVHVYRDCSSSNNSEYDDVAYIGVYNSAAALVENIGIPFISSNVVTLPNETNNPCFSAPTGVCVQSYIYADTLTLPLIAGGYTLVYQRCCRNFTIQNISTGTDVGISVTTHIPGSEVVAINSNAVYTAFPPTVICMGQPFQFDHSATDVDGDQLRYSLCAPLNTNVFGGQVTQPGPPPYSNVTYTGNYTSSNPIAASVPFSIDVNTGWLTGTPNQLGQYVVGICVEEWRNGVLINTTLRDFQFNVVTCNPLPSAAIADQVNLCSGLEAQFVNESPTGLTYFWDFGDPAVTSDTTSAFGPSYTYSAPGNYTATLVVNPGLSCADTTTAQFHASPPLNPQIVDSAHYCSAQHTLLWDFTATGGTGNSPTFHWSFGNGATPSVSSAQNPSAISFTEGSTATVIFTVTENTCSESDTLLLAVPHSPVSAIQPQNTFCDGYTYDYTNESQYAETYLWIFGAPESGDVSSLENPSYTYADTGHYTVQLIAMAEGFCPDTSTTPMHIYGLLDPHFEAPVSSCLDGNSFDFLAEGASTDAALHTWNFGGPASISSSSLEAPQNISWSNSGTFPVTLTIAENDCLESYTDSVRLFINPQFFADAEEQTGCSELFALFSASSIADSPVHFFWDFGDGNTSQDSVMYHHYTQDGSYDVSLYMSTTDGCIDSTTVVFPSIVQVYSPPTPGFYLNTGTVSLLDPTVTIVSGAVGATQCDYYMSDGGQAHTCDFTYTFTTAGYVDIQQVVTNPLGCTASITKTIYVDGFAVYIPNTFTPNNDGLNDVWFPQMLGVGKCHVSIFNRWGERIWHTESLNTVWQGSYDQGEHYCPDDVYNYLVEVEDLRGQPYSYKGHVLLTR